MITRIEVSGFKSLHNFALELHPGLNVMVGPNGSGKTNIIQFFEFISYLIKGEVSEAVSRAGGAGSIFRRSRYQEYQDSISATIYGCSPVHRKKGVREEFVTYQYFFEILFPREIETISYKRQTLFMTLTKSFTTADSQKAGLVPWQFAVEVEYDEKFEPKVKLLNYDRKSIRTPLLDKLPKTPALATRRIESLLKRFTPLHQSLISTLPRILYQYVAILQDLAGGETYNIVPSRVKVPEDSAKSPGIEKDGGGLAATLYAIQQRRHRIVPFASRYLWYEDSLDEFQVTLADVVRYVALANDAISQIEVRNDPFNNQLKVTLEVCSGDYKASLPLASMSDGTVKWIALITAVLTSSSIFSLEEPENYLHPLMQSQILKIMRDILFARKKYAFTIMTTHSETVLNGCEPEEIIVVSLDNGATSARRCLNANELREEIQRTGFGLGYYYLAGAVTNE